MTSPNPLAPPVITTVLPQAKTQAACVSNAALYVVSAHAQSIQYILTNHLAPAQPALWESLPHLDTLP